MLKIDNNSLLFRVSVLKFNIDIEVFKILPGLNIGLPALVLNLGEDFIIGVDLLSLVNLYTYMNVFSAQGFIEE